MTNHLTVAGLVGVIGFAFAVGAALLMVLNLLPKTRPAARQLWPLLASEAVILLAGALPWLLPPALLSLCLLIGAARLGFESGTVYSKIAGRRLAATGLWALSICALFAWFAETSTIMKAGISLLIIAAASTASGRRWPQGKVLASFIIFPLLPLVAFIHAAADPRLVPFLLLAFLLVEIFDSFSLLGGRLYGRTPLAPRLSPRKTWEGFATGAAALFGTVLALVFGLDLGLGAMLLSGLVIFVAAPAGDLLGSLPKRRAGIKDYPPVMTVQGGLLDIADSWLVAGPCLAGLAFLLGWV
ncbi:phosphatidate cytidylyltransferase [Aestuariivirga sp.]|uniref:phosphatidate cytidylyltransferase n=1 Tax=Aestuariivirga sp. TaxID=2650926 RepID=UPI003BAB22DD